MPAAQVLDREFFEIRAKILEVAASLDRMDRGDGVVETDARMQKVLAAIRILLQDRPDRPDRAEQLQLLFSRQYDADWKARFGLS